MACQRDQMASGKPYLRSCQICGLGPCKKYLRDDYPPGFPEAAKKKPTDWDDPGVEHGYVPHFAKVDALVVAAVPGSKLSLFQRGVFHLHSGSVSHWKIECDALTQDDWATLAIMIAERCGPFSEVVGVPRGGMPLAEALKKYVMTSRIAGRARGPRLVVDDVLSTGKSILEMMAVVGGLGWVVFARGPCPTGVKALFQMDTSIKVGLVDDVD